MILFLYFAIIELHRDACIHTKTSCVSALVSLSGDMGEGRPYQESKLSTVEKASEGQTKTA